MHALIVGEQGVGKSTLIHRVLDELSCPVSGFLTKKEDPLTHPELGIPLYLYPAGTPHAPGDGIFVGYCRRSRPENCAHAFDRFAPVLRALSPERGVILMDEIGVMESSSKAFQEAILAHLDGCIPVIAAVKHKDTDFLTRVRSHPNCRCFHVTKENRDGLFRVVLEFMGQQLSEAAEK